MKSSDWKIELSWQDPITSEQRQEQFTPPIAVGKDGSRLPVELSGELVAPLVIADGQISRYHALIVIEASGGNRLLIVDQNSTNGITVNGMRESQIALNSGDRLGIGTREITIKFSIPVSAPTVVATATPPVAGSPTITAQPPSPAPSPAPSPPPLPTIQLAWEDQTTGELQKQLYQPPIALGREEARMPSELRGLSVTKLKFNSLQVSRYHALIDIVPDQPSQLEISDRGSSGGTLVNNQRQTSQILGNGDVIQIGTYQITVSTNPNKSATTPTPAVGSSTILFNPNTGNPDPKIAATVAVPAVAATVQAFPPPCFQLQKITAQDLYASGLPVYESTYAAVGAGLGSFIWVDLLRIYGVDADKIVALGLEPKPYARYQRLCLNSQIPPHERLRSNSDSCPDNIWGWPSYALRESWRDLLNGRADGAFKYLWQVFAEPTLAETYTPRSGNVFASIDRETKRIGWDKIYQYGRILSIRQTTDGRYVIAVSQGQGKHCFWLSQYVHLSPGYAAIQFLPDLQEYRLTTGDFTSVLNAYEEHDHVYDYLEKNGGTLMIRGRGIVASRIVQRIYEARRKNPKISLLHLMRSPKPRGNRYGAAQRQVENHYEFQPFNWPKACWGGDLRAELEAADPRRRQELLADWGGTTTADRGDWKRIVQEGIEQGWYQIAFGEVERVEQSPEKRTITYIHERGFKGQIKLEADFILDATGLDAKVKVNPLFADLVDHYKLPINGLGRLTVTNDFELAEMRNDRGRMYAAGAPTLGGPYAAVDSFLGLEYAALIAADHLTASRAPQLKYLNGLRSLGQWFKWAFNQPPT
jgi:pSer/pThr/pTyr-binding forkhead associated (FHA) protein